MSTDSKNKKNYDLEDRTFRFAQNVRNLLKQTKQNQVLSEDKRQLIRSSGSVGANFIEAKEALSKKDFIMRIKISRKEAEETRYWLRLIDSSFDEEQQAQNRLLIQESYELMCILGSIINKNK